MKMRLILAVMALLCGFAAQAQQKVGTFSIIPRLGVSIANMTNNDVFYNPGDNSEGMLKSKYKAGVMAGADVEWQFHRVLSVSLGGYYSTQGSRYPNYHDGNESTGKYTGYSDFHTVLQYLNVPLMLNCYVAEGLALKAGVQAGFLLDSKKEAEATDYTVAKDGTKTYGEAYTVPYSAEYRSTDISIPVGVSYEYMNVVLDARYNIGLTNLYDANVASSKNQVFTFGVGYRFTL